MESILDLVMSSELYREIFERSRDAMIIHDLEGFVMDVNLKATEIFGHSKEEFLELRTEDLLPSTSQENFRKKFEELEREEGARTEIAFVRKDGTTFPAEVSSSRFEVGGRHVIQVVVRDISERGTVVSALRDTELNYRELFESSPEAIAIIDTDGTIMDVNDAAVEMTGRTRHDLVGHGIWDLGIIPAEQIDEYVDIFERQVSGVPTEPFSMEIEAGPGHPRYLEIYPSVIRREGAIVAIQAICRDVTDTKRALEMMMESDMRYRSLFNSTMEAVYINDFDGNFIDANDTALRMTGYSREEILNLTFSDLLEENDLSRAMEIIDRQLSGESDVDSEEFRLLTKDGRTAWVEVRASLITREDGDPIAVQGIAHDITRRKEAERAIRISEQKFRSLFNDSHDAIFFTSRDGKIQDFNSSFEALVGYEKEVLLDMNTTELYEDPEVRNAFIEEIEREGFVTDFEETLIDSDGNRRICLVTASLQKDGHGRITGYRGIIHDITERRRNRERIKRSLEEKEVLLKEVHHRVKNNMQVISSMLSLQASYVEDEDVKTIFTESEQRVKSMALIHDKLYRSGDLANIEFTDYIESFTKHLQQSYFDLTRNVELAIEGNGVALGINTAVPSALILNELVTNAFKHAFPDGRRGKVDVMLSQTGDRVRLSVADDGVGLPPGYDLGNSETLGMELVTTLVEQLEGELTMSTGSGTAFDIEFTNGKANAGTRMAGEGSNE